MEIVKLATDQWEDYRNLRLRALRKDPQAFGASYKTNLSYSEEEWKRRLKNAVEGKTDWLLFAKENSNLVGMLGAYMEKGDPHTATLVSMYVPKEERRKGIAARLMEAMLSELSQKVFVKRAKLTVNEKQTVAVSLYKKIRI